MIKDQLNATQALEEEFYETRINLNATCSKLLASMKRSGEQMRDLTSAFKNVTKLDERRPCLLKGAAEQAVKLFQVSLAQRRIQVEINIPSDAQADVPFHVAAFALANLVGNAKDAMSNGKIDIETQDDNNFILCHVTNTGPSIPNKVQKNLFQFGKSNKHGHNGWGLYFVHKSIKENGGNIWLSHSTAESTRFSVCLPKGRPI
jgi:signal transduction histidine kinase